MSVIIILIIVSVLVAAGFLLAFLWTVKTGQLDDDYTPSVRILFEENLEAEKISETDPSVIEKKDK